MPRDKELVSALDMQNASSTTGGFRPGEIYEAFDPTYGEVHAVFVKTVGAVGIAGSPMYPKTGSFTVAAEFLCDDDEAGASIVGEELCLGCWLGGVTLAAGYGFVQIYGFNIIAVTTDGSVLAKDTVLPTSAIGTWEGVTSDTLMTAVTNNPATRCGFAVGDDSSTESAKGTIFWDVHQPGC